MAVAQQLSLFYNQNWGRMVLDYSEVRELSAFACVSKDLNLVCQEIFANSLRWKELLGRDFGYYEPGEMFEVEIERIRCIAVNCMVMCCENFSYSMNPYTCIIEMEEIDGMIPKICEKQELIPEEIPDAVMKGFSPDRFYHFYKKVYIQLLHSPEVKEFLKRDFKPLLIDEKQVSLCSYSYSKDIPIYRLSFLRCSVELEGVRKNYRLLSLFKEWVPVAKKDSPLGENDR